MIYTVGETAKAAGTVDIPQNMAEKDVPKRFRTIRRELKKLPQNNIIATI